MGRESSYSIRLWGARIAIVAMGGILLPLFDMLLSGLLLPFAGVLGVLITAFTYRFSKGYPSKAMALAVVIGSCLVSSLLAGLSHWIICEMIKVASISISFCGIHSIETTILSSAFLATLAALIVALTVGNYIVPINSSSE